jgi:hypothetical protein
MYGTQNFKLVLAMQADLRHDMAKQRLAKKQQTTEHRTTGERRVFGLRLSLA